jgi:hypothetical protein
VSFAAISGISNQLAVAIGDLSGEEVKGSELLIVHPLAVALLWL